MNRAELKNFITHACTLAKEITDENHLGPGWALMIARALIDHRLSKEAIDVD